MIDYKNELNPAQYEAASTIDGPVLVIAGAGSGKTRTIVYRLANMIESGVPASSILLLTFTRKAAHEMLDRARLLLGQRGMGDLHHGGLAGVQGGTFHGFAYSILRIFRPQGYERDATIMDSSDSIALLQYCREELKAGKGDRSFPRNQAIMGLLSKSRNREQDLEDILRRESAHLLPHADIIKEMGEEYLKLKRSRSMLDYDDLLFELEHLLMTNVDALNYCRRRYRYLMVDEFQDTNLVQARITALIAGAAAGASGAEAGSGNIMAVGDDAQSIYAFRGANVQNILDFPKTYPGAKLIRLEENYRSTQPLLNLSNAVLDNARAGFKKRLFTSQPGSDKPQVLRPMSDLSQGNLVAAKVVELLRNFPPHEIAILFRAGYMSYHTEVQLNKLGVRFRKYGGIRYTDAAHIKDVMAYVRLVLNPLDFAAFRRITDFIKGVGSKTSVKLHQAMQLADQKALDKAFKKYPDFKRHMEFLNTLRSQQILPHQMLAMVIEHYQPVLEAEYPDDYPKRRQGLDELVQISMAYEDLDLFIADLSLDDPVNKDDERDSVTLSTIHSAKGLEWGAVIIIDLVEERFPSKHAILREDDFEEERRLMYVACTRAKKYLGLFVPATMFDRGSGGSIPAVPSPFVRELKPALYEELQESFTTGGWVKKTESESTDPRTRAALAGRAAYTQNFSHRAGSSYSSGSRFSRGGTGAESEALDFSGSGASKRYGRPLTGSFKVKPGQNSAEQDEAEQFEDVDMYAGSAYYSDWGSGPAPAPKFAKSTDSSVPAGNLENATAEQQENTLTPAECGYCTHKIFGRGKIVKHMPPDKYQVNFPGIGLKVIMGAYLVMEK